LWQLVRIFTAKLVIGNSGLPCTKLVGKDTTKRMIRWSPSHIYHGKGVQGITKDLEKMAADSWGEKKKKATHDSLTLHRLSINWRSG